MTTTTTVTGEYVNRSHTITGPGTDTGVPAIDHGTYISGIAPDSHVGRYVQSSPRRAPGRTSTGSIRLARSLLAHH